MATFVTGATGYLGSYVTARLLGAQAGRLSLLVRARDGAEAERKLWKALQLHMPFGQFERYLRGRIELVLGDITLPRLGLSEQAYEKLAHGTDSIIHIAASLNRRSERLCADVNLRGTLEVVRFARTAHDRRGLRRFSDVSTTAVAGERSGELVREDEAIDWRRRDYDPYARTKKFCEHMLETLLPDVPTTVFRPSTVMGDSRFGKTTQFDMVRAVWMLARMKVIPLPSGARHDIVPADYVGRAIADIHEQEAPKHRIYHLSAGEGSESYRRIMERLRVGGRRLPHLFVPALERPFGRSLAALAVTPRGLGVSGAASLLNVFWPYVTFDTVFDNRRVVEALGERPAPFSDYAGPLLEFALGHGFSYPHEPWPELRAVQEVLPSPA